MPIGRSYSKISSFILLFTASRINPSLLINSVYIISAPFCLHTYRKGGSLTSSIGASNRANSGRVIFPILIIYFDDDHANAGILFGILSELIRSQIYFKLMIKSIWAGNTPYSKILITVGIILISAIFF